MTDVDRALAARAADQHGVVDLRDLAELGFTPDAIKWRAARGRLHRAHRGVYAVGHRAISTDGRRLAAVKAVGPGAVLSHRSAAALWGLRAAGPARWDVTSPLLSGGRVASTSIAVHRTRRLPASHVTEIRGIPVTTVPRTLVDCAGLVTPRELRRLVHEAEVARRLDLRAVEAVIAALPRRRGTAALRAALATPVDGPSPTAFVTSFLALCADHGLPTPRTSVHLDMGPRLVEADALFVAERVVVELDGAAVHGTLRSFHHDRRRDVALAARGYLTVRLTWQRVTEESAAVAEELRAILAARACPSRGPWRRQTDTPG